MAPKIIEGVIQNGKVLPKKKLPKNISGMEVQIIFFPKTESKKTREQYFGALRGKWGDPLKYQRTMREELERKF